LVGVLGLEKSAIDYPFLAKSFKYIIKI